MNQRLFSSESVTEGHPDKVCDQVSDAVLDAIIAQDPMARVACECAATTGMLLLMGEITTDCYVDLARVARQTVCEIGYDRPEAGFDGNTCAVLTSIDEQSPDIAMGVNAAMEYRQGKGDTYGMIGAGDQGMMFGYACTDTEEKMPMPISLAHKLTRRLAAVRKAGELDYLLPDGKSQVTVQYEDDRPVRIDTIVLSTQHLERAEHAQIERDMKEKVIFPVLDGNLIDEQTRILVNPTGKFVLGGPQADSGLTGRKIIVDTYGGYARHGGGAFSGKDPTKVDRSAAYMARHIAKTAVAAGLADRCEVNVAYAIGVANPVSVLVDTFGTGKADDGRIARAIGRCFDLRPAAIIDYLQLRRPMYRQVASYGHFGRTDLDLPWERTDRAEELLRQL